MSADDTSSKIEKATWKIGQPDPFALGTICEGRSYCRDHYEADDAGGHPKTLEYLAIHH
jgi:hypothetical protein